jgi:hypothetical protein
MFTTVIAAMLPKLLDIGDKLIEDKDKRAEYAWKVQDRMLGIMEKFATTSTIPWVDATVKLSFALGSFILPLMRPLGSALLTGFAAYAHVKGIQLPEYIHAALYTAFPGWMASRHQEKKRAAP